jgi:threonine/homoserine/homoserine lactone efflux protein
MTLIDLEMLVPFIAAAYAMWATPGPNNMMLTYSGARFGVRATLPHIFGVVAGTALLNTVGMLGLTPIIERWPQSLVLLKIIGSFWLLWIGWKMANATPNAPTRQEERPMRFLPAILFQFANPKAISATAALAALVLVATEKNPWLLATVLLITPPLCFLANAPWALVGQSIRRFLATPLRWRAFTWATGTLTAGCTLFLWI